MTYFENQCRKRPLPFKRAASLLLAALLALPSVPTHAGVALEEIIVTAQKREQSSQNVGIAISAFSGEQLRKLGLTGTESLDDHTPGLYVTSYSASPNVTYFALRGVSQNDFADHHEAPVAVYTDGAYTSFIGGIGVNMFDIDRVEVLKGPQGTLFGRNATGGLVHLITKKPTEEFEGYAQVTLGDYDQRNVEAAFSGSLTENIAGRLSVMSSKNDGWIENTVGNDIGEGDNISVRGQLLFTPSEDLDILLNVRSSVDDTAGAGYSRVGPAVIDLATGLESFVPSGSQAHLDFCASGLFFMFPAPVAGQTSCVSPVAETNLRQGRWTPHITDENGVPREHKFEREILGTTATINWQINDGLNLVSVSDFQSIHKEYLEIDGPPEMLGNDFYSFQDADQFSQEIRFEGQTDDLYWQAGAYYLSVDGDYRAQFYNPLVFFVDVDNPWSLETTSYAIFGQVEYELSEKLTLIGGLRWTKDEKDYVYNTVQRCTNDPLGIFGAPIMCGDPGSFFQAPDVQVTGFIGDQSNSDISFRAQVDYKPNDDLLIYGSISRANKAGDFNAPEGAKGGPEIMSYDPEILTAYEVGFKSTILDGRARLNGSAFYYDYADYQAFQWVGISALVFNTDAVIFGGEVDFAFAPTENWEMVLGVSWLDSTAKDIGLPDVGQPGGNIVRDQSTPSSPDLTVNGLLKRDWQIAGGTLSLQAEFAYVASQNSSVINHPIVQFDAYTIAGLRLGYATEDGRWEADVAVKNITDEEYTTYGFAAAGILGVSNVTPGMPRWASASMRYNW